MFLEDIPPQELIDRLNPTVVNLLLVAENAKLDISEVIKLANKRGIRLAGGIFPRVISGDNHYDNGIVLKEVNDADEPYIVDRLNRNFNELKLPDLPNDANTCLVFLDGLMSNIHGFLERLYEKYWHNVSYLGAGCGSLSLKQKPCVFNNDGLFQDAGLILFSKESTSLGVRHGWEKIAGPFVANKTSDNKIIELNWKPAFQVYEDIVSQFSEMSFHNNDFFNISKGFPFGIYREGKEDIVRDPIAVDQDGSLLCVGHVSQNVALNILKGRKSSLIENAGKSVMDANINDETSDLLIVDCISRVLYLEDDFEKELSAVKNNLSYQKRLDIEGVLSIGEISSGKEGYLELYNKTIVVSAFS